jgi:hypothetical protein
VDQGSDHQGRGLGRLEQPAGQQREAPRRRRVAGPAALVAGAASAWSRASACSGDRESTGTSESSCADSRTAAAATSSARPARTSSSLEVDPSSTALAHAPRSSDSAVVAGSVRRSPRSRSSASIPSRVAVIADPTPSSEASSASTSGVVSGMAAG